MSFDELKNMAMGWVNDWNKGKLKNKLKETAQQALDTGIENIKLEEKVRQLQDEIRQLKGEKKKPKFKKVNSKDLEQNSEKKPHKKSSKLEKIEIDKVVECDVAEELPKDAKFIGHREVVVQELIFKRNNLKFKLKRYWSEAEGKIIEGEIPEKYLGSEFGPELRSFILYQFYKNRVPHRKIIEMLSDIGISISKGTVCNILNKFSNEFEEELESAKKAAIKKCSFVHLDETSARFNGIGAYTFGVSNPFFTWYKTLLRKNKKSAKEALGSGSRSSPIRFLITDDAPNFKKLIKNHQLCWIHEIRKYKLEEVYKKIEFKTLDLVINEWRKFYKLLIDYGRNPVKKLKEKILNEFSRITSATTCVKPIDDQLRRTAKNKDKLLLFLRYPQIPIHNNMAENDIRERVIKRKISLQNRSREGMKAWDIMLSIISTCRKLNISYWKYITDRTSKKEIVPYLAQIIANF